MQIRAAIDKALRLTEFDTIRPSELIEPGQARQRTMQNNVLNGFMYGVNAFVPLSGVILNPLVAFGKSCGAMWQMMLAMSFPEQGGEARMNLAGDLLKSAGENFVVGAASCLPGAGPVIAGLWSARSFVDANRALKT
ncbi:MAG TPA: hypothetical protein VLC93_04350 [Myxococcota bacterium]|nr:hypothetical protein [Myxococcota bacterium]